MDCYYVQSTRIWDNTIVSTAQKYDSFMIDTVHSSTFMWCSDYDTLQRFSLVEKQKDGSVIINDSAFLVFKY